ncbi:MAG: hypothetical protein AAF626_12375 [Pseudomonadota bacterium]
MKKSARNGAKKAKKRKVAVAQAEAPTQPDRRNALRWVRNGAIAAVGLGAAGYFSVGSVRATMAEYDLTRIGQGRPTVVQIHDPQCSECSALQRQTRRALRTVGSDRIDYVIADIRTAEGSAYATSNGAQRVTLLLLDGNGAVRNVLQGPNQADTLAAAFEAHITRYGR